MEVTSLTAAAKLIMMLLCLCGIPQDKETLWIDVIHQKGVVETIVAKPTADGYALFESDKAEAEKLMEIRRDGSSTSFSVSPSGQKIDLKKIFPAHDFKDFSTVTKANLKAAEGGDFKLTRSGGTAYVTGPSGIIFSIHK